MKRRDEAEKAGIDKRITCGGKNCGDCYDCLKVNLYFAMEALRACGKRAQEVLDTKPSPHSVPSENQGIEAARLKQLLEIEAEWNRVHFETYAIPESNDWRCNRYNTDNEMVLHVWRPDESYDVRFPFVRNTAVK